MQREDKKKGAETQNEKPYPAIMRMRTQMVVAKAGESKKSALAIRQSRNERQRSGKCTHSIYVNRDGDNEIARALSAERGRRNENEN